MRTSLSLCHPGLVILKPAFFAGRRIYDWPLPPQPLAGQFAQRSASTGKERRPEGKSEDEKNGEKTREGHDFSRAAKHHQCPRLQPLRDCRREVVVWSGHSRPVRFVILSEGARFAFRIALRSRRIPIPSTKPPAQEGVSRETRGPRLRVLCEKRGSAPLSARPK